MFTLLANLSKKSLNPTSDTTGQEEFGDKNQTTHLAKSRSWQHECYNETTDEPCVKFPLLPLEQYHNLKCLKKSTSAIH